MRSGSMLLVSAGSRDSQRLSRPCRRMVVTLDDGLLRQAAAEIEVNGRFTFESKWGFEDDQLRLLMTEIEREMVNNWSMGQLYGDLLGMALSIALVKKYAHVSAPLPLAKGGLSRGSLKRVLDYMVEHSHEDLHLVDLAEVAETSVFHFARTFNECVGMPPHQYLTKLRIERAKTMLLTQKRSAAQIATATGFSSATQFAKVFRRVVGLSPTEWKDSMSF